MRKAARMDTSLIGDVIQVVSDQGKAYESRGDISDILFLKKTYFTRQAGVFSIAGCHLAVSGDDQIISVVEPNGSRSMHGLLPKRDPKKKKPELQINYLRYSVVPAQGYLHEDSNKFAWEVQHADIDASEDMVKWFHLLGDRCLRKLPKIKLSIP